MAGLRLGKGRPADTRQTGNAIRDIRDTQRTTVYGLTVLARRRISDPVPVPIPVVLLCPIDHLDLADLDEAYAAELGRLTVRLERALTELGGVARVHVMKVGDGSEHLHVWFFARPDGLLQLRGSSLSDWTDCLPPMPTDEWDAVARELAVRLAETRGRALG